MGPSKIKSSTALAFASAVGMSLGFLDITLSLLSAPVELASFHLLLPPLASTSGVLFSLYALLWFGCVGPLGKKLQLEGVPLAVGLAIAIAAGFQLSLITGLLHMRPTTNDLFRLSLIGILSLLVAIVTYKWTAGTPTVVDLDRPVLPLLLLLPILMAVITLDLWIIVYPLNYALSIATTLTVLAGLALAVITIRLVCAAASKPVTAARVLLLMQAIVFVSPIGLFMHIQPRAEAVPRFVVSDRHAVKRIILITVDALRADAISGAEPMRVTTPNIDRLTRDGLLFNRAFSPAPWTLPSLASLLTGLCPHVHLATKPTGRLPTVVTTLAEYLRRDGYLTGVIGYNRFLSGHFNLLQGFSDRQVFPVTMGSSFGARLLPKLLPRQLDPSTTDLTALASQWIESKQNEDFFLWIHYFDPHMPYTPPEEFVLPGQPQSGISESFYDWQITPAWDFLVPPESERKSIRALYEAEVRYVDQSIGHLLDGLKRLDLYEDSLIILTSDHGEEFWEHGGFAHGHSLYNELLNVPLILKLPNSTALGKVSDPVVTASLLPTILDLAQTQYDKEHISFPSLPISGDVQQQAILGTALYVAKDQMSLVFKKHKYIISSVSGQEELYDLDVDPLEQRSNSLGGVALLTEAEAILEEHGEQSRRLRNIYGIRRAEETDLQQALRVLKTLGYAQ